MGIVMTKNISSFDDDFLKSCAELVVTTSDAPIPERSLDESEDINERELRILLDTSTNQWTCTPDESLFWSTNNVIGTLPPGLYKCVYTDKTGHSFQKLIVSTDDLISVPDTAGAKVISEIEKFWTLKDDFKKRGFLHKRGVLMFGEPGCHAKDTEILMFDGSVKKVQDIEIGEYLMGPDSACREVLKTCTGNEKMYKITPTKGDSFVVNENHVLSLCSTNKPFRQGTIIDITVKDFINQSYTFKTRMKLFRTGVEFKDTNTELLVPPYILGLWLGDGTTAKAGLTTMDTEIIDEWSNWLLAVGCDRVYEYKRRVDSRCVTLTGVSYNTGRGKPTNYRNNPANRLLHEIGVLNNKHIPLEYLTGSRKDRLELLAGLIDTDGYGQRGVYDFISKSSELANGVVFLARSLGLAAYIHGYKKQCEYLGIIREGNYWRVSISGDCSTVPVKLERKKLKPRTQIKNHLVTGFTVELYNETDEYYGFSVDKDNRYLMGDFTVTHNSGKTASIQLLVAKIISEGGIAIYADDPGNLTSCLQMLRRLEPKRRVIVILEDFETLTDRQERENEWLSVLDGEAQIDDVVFLATTNYIDNLDKRFTDRPSRFDVIVPVPMPGAKARALFIMSKEKSLSHEEVIDWTERSVGFSYAHLKELIISVKCLGNDIEFTIDRLRNMQRRKSGDVDLSYDPDGENGSKRSAGFLQDESSKPKTDERIDWDEIFPSTDK